MNYGCQLYNTASAGRLKNLDSIHGEGVVKYTGAFRTSPVEANDPFLELRFLYKLKSNTSYIETLNRQREENERSIKPTGVYLRRLEQRYMEGDKRNEPDTATL